MDSLSKEKKMGLTAKIENNLNDTNVEANKHAIELKDIIVRYPGNYEPVLDIEYFKVIKGERIAVIGPSGAGKTTLLRLINGYVEPERGYRKIMGEDMDGTLRGSREMRRKIGFIFQEYNLIDRASVLENVLWGRLGRVNPFLSVLGYYPERDKKAALKAISEVDLISQVNQRADCLSSGQKQRVAIARVLTQQPEIILADEPVSNLDPSLGSDILGLLEGLSIKHSYTLIMSLHQPEFAARFAQKIVGLREGKIIYQGPADKLNDSVLDEIYGRDNIREFPSIQYSNTQG